MTIRIQKFPFFLTAIVAVVVPPCLLTLFFPMTLAVKWVCWLIVGMALALLPLFLDGEKDFHRLFFLVSATVAIFIFSIYIIQFPLWVVAGALFMGTWQAFWWCAARNKTFKSLSFRFHAFLLTVGWIASYYYVSWASQITYSGPTAVLALALSAVFILVFIPIACRRISRPVSAQTPVSSMHQWSASLLIVAAVAALIWESLRVDRIDPIIFFHHWGVYVGPLQSMRQVRLAAVGHTIPIWVPRHGASRGYSLSFELECVVLGEFFFCRTGRDLVIFLNETGMAHRLGKRSGIFSHFMLNAFVPRVVDGPGSQFISKRQRFAFYLGRSNHCVYFFGERKTKTGGKYIVCRFHALVGGELLLLRPRLARLFLGSMVGRAKISEKSHQPAHGQNQCHIVDRIFNIGILSGRSWPFSRLAHVL